MSDIRGAPGIRSYRDLAIAYLSPPRNGFWKWSRNREAIQWIDGPTIVFAKELAEILRPQASRGLPSLDTILLVLSATRDNWLRTDDFATAELPWIVLESIQRGGEKDEQKFAQVIAHLNKIHELNNDVKISVDAKQVLIDMLFSDHVVERTWSYTGEEVLRFLDHGIGEEIVDRDFGLDAVQGSVTLNKALLILYRALPDISAEALRLWRDTGLEEVPLPAEEAPELPVRTAMRALLATLKNDPEFADMARMTTQLMSTLTLPKPISMPEDLPQGGVSDITNRGSLDRLLISELVHDDLTLAVRVAVNEAMYLRRESPRQDTERRQIVVLDCGIRMWGVPRVVATSFAMAMAANSLVEHQFDCFSAQQRKLKEVNLTTRDGVVEHLKSLQPELHVGEALQAVQSERSSFAGDCDVVLVTSVDAVTDPEFRQELSQFDFSPLFVAAIDREGLVQLNEVSTTGWKLVKQVNVALEQIAEGHALVDKSVPKELPAIFNVSPFPLLLCHSGGTGEAWEVMTPVFQGLLQITSDRRLLLWKSRDLGARELSDKIQSKTVLWKSYRRIRSSWLAIVGSSGNGRMQLLAIDSKDERVTQLELNIDAGPLGFAMLWNELFAIYDDHVSRVDLLTGSADQHVELPERLHWHRDRFFRGSDGSWFAMGSTGASVEFLNVPFSVPSSSVIELFESEFVEGLIGLTHFGELCSIADGKRKRVAHDLPKPIRVEEISSDGNEVVISSLSGYSKNGNYSVKIQVSSGKILQSAGNLISLSSRSANAYIGHRNLRNRFREISIWQDGSISLSTRKDRCLVLSSRIGKREGSGLRLRAKTMACQRHSSQTFESAMGPEGTGYRLHVATWDDGSQAWLDSRGLLHLRSSQLDIPEISIVLTDKICAGWCSNGMFWGPRFFTGVDTSVEATDSRDNALDDFAKNIIASC